MNRLVFLFVGCEIAYFVAVRVLARNFSGDMFDREIWWTMLRLLSAIALSLIFVRLPRPALAGPTTIPRFCLLATGMFLAPILVGDMGFTGSTRYLFAAT